METIISIDLGTTALKVAIVELSGRLVAAVGSEYPIISSRPGYAEQDPRLWWQALVQGCSRLREENPEAFASAIGVGISGQMHTQVCLDSEGRILRPAISWMDQRCGAQVAAINQDPLLKELVFRETQNLATTTYTAPQLKWVQENQPELWNKVRHVLVAKDFLKYRLTGTMAIDFAEASGTLLFNVEQRKWSDAMFDLFGFPRSILPEAAPSDEIIGRVSREAARETGIPIDTPVVNGSSDNSATALGAGMISSGQVTLIIGTAGVITVCSDKPLPDPQNRTLCWSYCLRDRWVSLGVTQTAGESLNWFKNSFADGQAVGAGDIFQQFNKEVEKVPAGSEGLVFLPYLNGERTPYWDASARGVYFGISLSTGKGHFIRAIMEGVSFALRHCVETVESLGIRVDEIQAVGGGLKSPAWLEILGKVMNRPIRTVREPDTGHIGNMLLCARGLGAIDSIEDTVRRIVRHDREVHFSEPDPVYEHQYGIFLHLYEDLKGRYREAFAST
ncbi:MAG TPA: xylulokinase [Spirochaetia bacterium]|nr:xylulokinase [Spirochaetia bacterium]